MQPLKPFTLVTAIMALATASSASAAYKIDIQQVGPNVVASGSGSIDLDALLFGATFSPGDAQMAPNGGFAAVGSSASYSVYLGISGPSSFGSGGEVFADSSTGPLVFIWDLANELGVPDGYSSGASLGSSTATFNNSTFASLGLTPGTYIWSWGQRSSADTFTIQVGNAVPEPATWAMMLLGFGAVGLAMRRKRSTRALPRLA